MTKKKILLTIIISIIVLAGVYIAFFREKGITGNEWFAQQNKRVEDVNTFCEEMDEVFTLYIGGYMSEEDFGNEIILLRQQFSILKAKYEKIDSETKILTGKHSWISKKGEEVLADLFGHIEEFLAHDYTGIDSESAMANYLVFQDTIEEDMAGYIVLVDWLEDYNNGKVISDDNTGK